MSQNGPYPGQGWSAGGSSGSDEPYTQPADPWGDAAIPGSPGTEGGWGGQPMSVPPGIEHSSYAGYPAGPPAGAAPVWQAPPVATPPQRRNTPIIALVITLGLLICGGLGTAGWLVQRNKDAETARGGDPAPPASSASDASVPDPQSSADARFVAKGQCVRNEGTAKDQPKLKIVTCTAGTFLVLKRVDGRTTGEGDAESKCSKVKQYTKWYFYDSNLDEIDFVLCLREYGDD